MTSRADRNVEYVNRNYIKRWLLANARPAAVRDLYETIRDDCCVRRDCGDSDLVMKTMRYDQLELDMLAAVYKRLVGKDIEQ